MNGISLSIVFNSMLFVFKTYLVTLSRRMTLKLFAKLDNFQRQPMAYSEKASRGRRIRVLTQNSQKHTLPSWSDLAAYPSLARIQTINALLITPAEENIYPATRKNIAPIFPIPPLWPQAWLASRFDITGLDGLIASTCIKHKCGDTLKPRLATCRLIKSPTL